VAAPKGDHVVLGGSGGAGAAIARTLLEQGKRVRAVSREGRPAGGLDAAEWVAADARDAGQLRAVCRDAAVIYHAVNVPYPAWPEVLPAVMESVIAAAESSSARLVYVDNLYMYGPVDLPMREDLPPAATTRKGRLRAALASRLLVSHREGRIRVTIGRCSDFYGPGVTSAVSETVFRAVLAGKTARWFGSLDQPHSLSFIDDAATAFVTLGEDERSMGEVWHLPVAEPVTGRMFIALASEVAGTRPRAAALPAWAIRLAGLAHPLAREMGELTYQFARPFVVDDRKYRRVFGGGSTPYREALARTLAWYRARAR
jgi:nucleoside-diphosphate-sugar epimerase